VPPNCNVNFLDEIKAEQAYILGLFFADGCIYQHKCGSWYVKFASKDKDFVELVKSVLQATGKIRLCSNDLGTWYSLDFGSKVLAERFIELGVEPRKSFKDVTWNSIPDDHFHHFVRGFFDGDGCITAGKTDGKYYAKLWLFGREGFVKRLINKMNGLGVSGWNFAAQKKPIYRAGLTRQSKIAEFHSWIYSGTDLFLQRKKKRFDQLVIA